MSMTDLQGNESTVDNRFEILFVYDVEEGNPNGDPLNEDRPRVDEKTGENIVTDVRLKRTVRDYFIDQYDEDGSRVFVRSAEKEDGTLKTREELIKDELGGQEVDLGDATKSDIKEALFSQYIDLRLFGATLAVEDVNIGQTGPTQFKMGRSFHEVDTRYIQQSVTLPSEESAEQGTFADRYDLPYSLIRFHGIVNENNAEETGLTYDDVHRLADGIWNGTKSLITHSKMEHKPQMLLLVEYEANNFHIGGLNNAVDIHSEKDDTEIRSFADVELVTDTLRTKLDDDDNPVAGVHMKSEVPLDLPVETTDLSLRR
jgi:CRISPR-associated protein Csh2